MRNKAFFYVDVFASQRWRGNPLCVFPDARGLSELDMGHIAREANLSETIFIFPPAGRNGYKTRIFTPSKEIPFAGHPAIGAAFVLAIRERRTRLRSPDRFRLACPAGVVTLRLEWAEEMPSRIGLEALPAVITPARLDLGELKSALTLPASTLPGPPVVASVGTKVLLVEVENVDQVAGVRPARASLLNLCARAGVASLAVFCRQGLGAGVDIHMRCFSSRLPTLEDPGTGSAAGALGAHLLKAQPRSVQKLEVVIEQGIEMGRTSRMEVDVERDGARDVLKAVVWGRVVLVWRGWLQT